MGATQLRPPEGAATPKELDLLEGIDLGSERHHRPGKRTTWIIAAVVAVIAIAAAVIVTLVLTGGESVTQPEAAIEAPLTARELGRDPGPTARPSETDVIVLDYYGLAPARDPVAEPPNQTSTYNQRSAPYTRSGESPNQTTTPVELTLRELGRDPGPTARPSETDVIVLDYGGLTEARTVAAVPKVNPGELLPM